MMCFFFVFFFLGTFYIKNDLDFSDLSRFKSCRVFPVDRASSEPPGLLPGFGVPLLESPLKLQTTQCGQMIKSVRTAKAQLSFFQL